MRILVTGAFGDPKPLENLGHDIVFMQYEKDSLPCGYEEVDAVVCNGLFLYHDIEKFTNLKLIQLTSAGFDRAPMDYVRQKKIAIYNARGVYSVPMAEFALFGALSIFKQSRFFQKNQNEHYWGKHRGLLELYGKTACIVGCGSVGNECAVRFKAMGMKIIGVDIQKPNADCYDEFCDTKNILTALPCADVVVLTLPLTEKTKGMFDKKLFEVFKEGAVLVNIARGAIVNTQALINALKEKLCGAVLDVFEQEPLLEDSELWNIENVIITPHNSFVGDNNRERLTKLVKENLKRNI